MLDKAAGFVNACFGLGHDPDRVDLRGAWYIDLRERRALHFKIADRPNLTLRGLYWLSLDIVGEAAKGPDGAISPDAAHPNARRDALEHRCLVLTTETLGVRDNDNVEPEGITAFRHNTERMLELVHEALILLSLAMHEERCGSWGIKEMTPWSSTQSFQTTDALGTISELVTRLDIKRCLGS